MNFLNRFGFFLIGVFLGISIILISLKKSDRSFTFNYFPNNRVKNFLINNKISISNRALCQFNCYNLDTTSLKTYISFSKVDFNRSQISGIQTNLYYLSSNKHDLIFKTFPDSVILTSISSDTKDCTICD